MAVYKGSQRISGSAAGGHTIQDDGTDVTARTNLNFQAPLTVTDDSTNDATVIDITIGADDVPDLAASKITSGTFDAEARINSAPDGTNATDGHVLTADGSGGVAWEAASGGGGDVDIETGTWTPTFTVGQDGPTLTTHGAVYTKVGDLVTVLSYVTRDGAGDNVVFRLNRTSLPFSVGSPSGFEARRDVIGLWTTNSSSTGSLSVNTQETVAVFKRFNDGAEATTSLIGTNSSGNAPLWFKITYYTY